MLSNSKILTVSYGTFSCTLEGFDDSFGTMKAIAEYFRDLAADDRYFGAEPPQPDAQMLARIAQKEISRRVEARQHDGKIVLSALADNRDDSSATETPAPQAEPATRREAKEPVADMAVEDGAVEDWAVEDMAVEQEPPADSTGTAADTTPSPSTDIAQLNSEDKTEEDNTDDVIILPAPDVEEDENETTTAGSTYLPDAEAFFAESTEPEVAEDEEQNEPAPAPAQPHAQDSIAAKLQRIRAVVARQEDEDDYAEDEHASDNSLITHERAPADHTAESTEPVALDDMSDRINDSVDDDDDIAAILNRLDQDDDEPTRGQVDERSDNLLAEVDDADQTENLFEDDEPANERPSAPAAKITAAEGLRIEVEKAPAASGDSGGTRARVIKVKRVDLEAAIEKGDLEEVEAQAEPKPEPTEAVTPQSSLSAEDEHDLARELAALEAELYGDAAEPENEEREAPALADEVKPTAPKPADPSAAVSERPARVEPTARDILPSIDAENGPDMNRLMAETDQQMHEPEGATRRDAFAHLRAAVAAKKADEALGTDKQDDDGDDAYRNDLADVVRPRRPVSQSSRTERPSDGRPAPLKLVAEQRIDTKAARPAGPVRPRRVAAVTEKPPVDEADSFADFAAEMGATRLPDLLEAAAAYMSFVEGREQFSRPQLMNKVRQVGPDGFTREDGLRSFGQLLRMGKIEKIKGGRFTVSDDIGFRPDNRAAG